MEEQTIDKQPFKVNLALVVVVLIGVGSAIVAIGADRGRIAQNTQDIQELKAFDRQCVRDMQAAEVNATGMERDLAHIRTTVDEIREHLIKWSAP